MNRTDILNKLAEQISAKSYLEIGIEDGKNFNAIKVEHKIGVDSSFDAIYATYTGTSDDFFDQNNEKFDLIFIDGLHHKLQVFKDIANSRNWLSATGIIMCHDMNPSKEKRQIVPRIQEVWNGDCWKAWVYLRTRVPWNMYVIDEDEGCGIINPRDAGPMLNLKLPNGVDSEMLNWKNLVANRNWWLNLKSELEIVRG